MKKHNKKVPGFLPPPKTENDGKITNLKSKMLPELMELRDRQLKLINNKMFISKLDDKGEKIKTFLDKVLLEIKARQEEEHACELLNRLSLNTVNKEAVEHVEWEGKINHKVDTFIDSDDDSGPEDIINVLSQRTAHEKKVRILQPDKKLISPEDLISIGEIPHVNYIVSKTECNKNAQNNDKFKAYKTTISDVHDPRKEILRKKHKYWEPTAATPPPIINGPVKGLSIEESLNLQKEFFDHVGEIVTQHAVEKLMARTGIKMAELPENPSVFGSYRKADSEDSYVSDTEGSDQEVHDEESDRGGVIYTITN